MIRGDVAPVEKYNPISKEFGPTYFGPIFERGQKQGYFREGDPSVFGDLYWKELVGYMSIINFDKSFSEYHPDMEQLLLLFKK